MNDAPSGAAPSTPAPPSAAPHRAPITTWPCESRPRERLLARGATALTDAELVAVFLRTGLPGKDAVTLGGELLARFGGLNGLLNAPRADFLAQAGLGQAKYATLQAVMEMTHRAQHEQMKARTLLTSPQAVENYLRQWLRSLEHEEFVALFLDQQHRLICAESVFKGTLNQTAVYPREIVRHALRANAAAVIFAHNHPSGVAEPSQADIHLTRQLRTALELVDIRVLDHFIVAQSQVLSLAQRGLI